MFQKSQCFDHQSIIKYQRKVTAFTGYRCNIFTPRTTFLWKIFYHRLFYLKKAKYQFCLRFFAFLKASAKCENFRLFREILLQSVSQKNAKFSPKEMRKCREKNSERWLDSSNSLYQTFIKVKEEKLLLSHKKTLNIELSEQRILQFCLRN